MINNQLSTAIRLALVFGAASTSFVAAQAVASEATAQEGKVERIAVTGSRIKRTDMETAQPILTITAADIDRSGLGSLGDVLKEVATNGAALGLQTNNGNSSGRSTVNLRNCGSARTLVLVNGRRWVSGLTGSVDVSTIPLAAVRTIEVLKDGASSVYGTDAICGVVNVLTKNDFDGAELRAYIGETSEQDGRKEQYSATFGGTNGKTSALLNVAYTKQEPILGANREISSVPIYGLPANVSASGGRASPTTPYGGFPVRGENGTTRYTLTQGAVGCETNKDCSGKTGDFKVYDPNTDGYNYAPVNFIQQPQETISLYAQASHEVTDNILWTVDTVYNKRTSQAQLAAQPLGGMRVSKDSVYNPFEVDLSGVSFRPIVAPRQYNADVTTWRFSTALEGDFDALGRTFTWDAGSVYTKSSAVELKGNFFHSTSVATALGASFIDSDGIARCGKADSVISGCVPFNIFGGPDGVTQDMIDYISVAPRDLVETEMWAYNANIGTELFELPAGTVAAVIGAETRREKGFNEPDTLTVLGQVLGANAATPTRGGFSLDEFYAEVNIPLVADLPFAELVDLNVAVRHSDYSSFGTTTNASAKLSYRVDNNLMFRTSYNEGFRAPTLSNLYQGRSDARPSATDPCSSNSNSFQTIPEVRARCAAAGLSTTWVQQDPQVRAVIGGNEDTQPETSTSWSAGFVFSPEAIEGLGITVDWYRIEIENAIGSRSARSILTRCYEQGLAPDCALITRDMTGNLNGNAGEVSRVVSTTMNFLGGLHTEGLDANVDYRFENDLGNWRVNWDTTYVIYHGDLDKLGEGEVTRDGSISGGNEAGRLSAGSSGGGSNHRVKSNMTLSWNNDDFAASITAQYLSKQIETCSNIVSASNALNMPELADLCSDKDHKGNRYAFKPGTTEVEVRPDQDLPENKLSPTVYFDAQGSWFTPWNSTVTVGIRNLFDKEPPKAYSAFANTYDPAYRTPGRFYYLSVTHKF